ncbi:unnamed protein product, partial [Sphacelaria rigidula]
MAGVVVGCHPVRRRWARVCTLVPALQRARWEQWACSRRLSEWVFMVWVQEVLPYILPVWEARWGATWVTWTLRNRRSWGRCNPGCTMEGVDTASQ